MGPRDFIDGIRLIEVSHINNYALEIASLSMAVRGLSFLVLTWTTVVLLGGFVSDLSKKDFWSLTVITLVQPAGIFEFLLKEKAAEVLIKFFHVLKQVEDLSFEAIYRGFDVFLVIKVVRAISSYQLELLYMLGLYISTVVSLWRLMQHDYGDTNGGENLKPGLNILYSLAVAQGVVLCYKTMFEFGPRNVAVKRVADFYSLDTDLVSDYLEETLTGCMKDLSFAEGRNLVTYAVDLMESKLRNKHLSGVRILGTIMLQANFRRSGQADLMKQLLTGRACFSHMVQRLVERFGPRSPYNIETRVHAATIMASVAGNIRLEQFPARMILEYISFLLHPYAYEEYRWRPEGYEPDSHCLPEEYEQGWLLEGDELMHLYWHETTPTHRGGLTASAENDKGLMVQGLRILQKLIMHEDNRRVIINTEGMLSRVMAPLISDQLHRHHDDEWCSVAEESLELISRLLASPGEMGADMRRNISTNKEIVISTLKSIIACPKCEVLLKRQAVEMLLDLSENTPSIVITGSSSSRIFKWILLHIFIVEDKCFGKMCGSIHWAKKSTKIRRLAGERLQEATLNSQAEGISTMSMLQESVSVTMGDLSRAIADDGDDTYRFHAVQILEHLCILYTKDDVFLEEMKKAILEVMRKVLKEIFGWGSAPPGHDIEDGLSAGHVQLNTSYREHQNGQPHNGRKLREAMLSLCFAVIRCWIYKDRVFTRKLNNIAAGIRSSERGCRRMGTTFHHLVRRADYLMEKEKKKEKEKKDQRSAN